MSAEAARTAHGAFRSPGRKNTRPGRGRATSEICPLARSGAAWYNISVFRYKPNGKSKTRTAKPKKQIAPCAIGLPFAGIFDPVTQGVFHT